MYKHLKTILISFILAIAIYQIFIKKTVIKEVRTSYNKVNQFNENGEIIVPKILEPFKEKISNSVREYVKVDLIPMATDIYDSKVGGKPYFPKSMKFPMDKNGRPMKLLSQVNFSQMPSFENYPTSGIFQIFISVDDKFYGANILGEKGDFKVFYHKDILKDKTKLMTNIPIFPDAHDYFPVMKEGKMFFSIAKEAVPISDYACDKIFGKDFINQLTQVQFDKYITTFDSSGHKIGGYACFVQDDPRQSSKHEGKILLLQLDTDGEMDMMWGDGGVANIFISPSDLKKLDFSNLLYTWDCS